MVASVLPKLFEKTNTIDLNSRHGSVLAIGEIMNALAIIAKSKNNRIEDLITNELRECVKSLVPQFRERHYFRGLGGELMRQACSDFIKNCSLASMPFHDDPIAGNFC